MRARASAILEAATVDNPAKAANINVVDPLSDSRWDDLVARHPKASAFHERGWLRALAHTYGYEPLVLTTAPPGEQLADGVVLCRISSWLTGTRLVSLPFADHCEPLLDDLGDFQKFMNWLREECYGQRQRYVELRLLAEVRDAGQGFQPSRSYWFHELDLGPSSGRIFQQMHKNSFQRKVRRAERERLSYESGSSEKLVEEFYRLVLMTRSRHRLIPQPLSWFRNLVQGMGCKIQIRLARKNGTPIAAMLTLRHRSSVVYKYGCSDEKFHHLGGMPFLFWRLIEESKASGAEKIDFGRSDLDNEGLITFKDRLGTHRKLLTYYTYTNSQRAQARFLWESRGLRGIVSSLPDVVLSTVGRFLYKHLG